MMKMMVASALMAALIGQGPTARNQLEREAQFLAKLPRTATYADLLRNAPKGVRFKVHGFYPGYRLGNHVEFSGSIVGHAALLSKKQAADYVKWYKDRKAVKLPDTSIRPEDSLLHVVVFLEKESLGHAESQKEEQRRVQAAARFWGPKAIVPWRDGQSSGDYEWSSNGLSYEEFPEAPPTYQRRFSQGHVPSEEKFPYYTKGDAPRAVKADYDALSKAIQGRRQTRLMITSGQLYDLRKCRLKPFGWKINSGSIGTYENHLAFAGRPGGRYVELQVDLHIINGKRVIICGPLAG